MTRSQRNQHPRCQLLLRSALLRIVMLLTIGMLGVSSLVPLRAPDVQAAPVGSRIPWQGSGFYLHGANLPWLNWGREFGGGSGNGGVTSTSSQSTLRAAFQQLHDSGTPALRWWVFPGD